MVKAYKVYKQGRWNKPQFVGRAYTEDDARNLCRRNARSAFRTDNVAFYQDGDNIAGIVRSVADFSYLIQPVSEK